MFELLLVCCIAPFVILLFVSPIFGGFIRQVNQYERGILFYMGKYSKMVGPGWHFVIPVLYSMKKVDIRTKTVDLSEQEAITADNVSTKISAILYFKVVDSSKAILEVENYIHATALLAETTMRTVVGEFTLDELLQHRQRVADKIEEILSATAGEWGLEIGSVELKDVILPETMKRTIAKQAEAEREKRATIINSEGEVVASENLAKAARTMAESPGALHLRTLNSINDISSDESNTIVFALPIEMMKAIEGFSKVINNK